MSGLGFREPFSIFAEGPSSKKSPHSSPSECNRKRCSYPRSGYRPPWATQREGVGGTSSPQAHTLRCDHRTKSESRKAVIIHESVAGHCERERDPPQGHALADAEVTEYL